MVQVLGKYMIMRCLDPSAIVVSVCFPLYPLFLSHWPLKEGFQFRGSDVWSFHVSRFCRSLFRGLNGLGFRV